MKPRIFVSSTFYDLKFIREDLATFIKAHDFEPIMFEDGDIGYTPGKELDKSCYDTMKNADMVLLIIGGEYGSPATGEKKDGFEEYISVTRNEFRSAAQAGIPIFVFIESNVYAEYGVYEVNLDNIENKGISIEFKATKNINIFRFIKEIRTLSDKPIQEFRRSVDIKSFLSKQWSDMFKNYLALLRSKEENASLQNTVSDMEALIKQMSIMLDAVGKKVIGDNDKTQYDDIVQKQNDVQARRISQLISNGIKISTPIFAERRENVKKLLEVLESVYTEHQSDISSDEHELGDIADEMVRSLIKKLDEQALTMEEATYTFVLAIPEIANAISNAEIKRRVTTRLMPSPNYRKIFVEKVEETKQEPNE